MTAVRVLDRPPCSAGPNATTKNAGQTRGRERQR
jgi:hypothetical protein